jgi:hypothetical protein
MSDYSVLGAVSGTLQMLLTNNITNQLPAPLDTHIYLNSPVEMQTRPCSAIRSAPSAFVLAGFASVTLSLMTVPLRNR